MSKLSIIKSFGLLILLTFSANFCFAGGSGTGGGKGVVCRNGEGKISKPVELLDLWEARQIHKLKILEPTQELEAELFQALSRWKNYSEIPTTPYNNQPEETSIQNREDLTLAQGILGLVKHSRVKFYRNVKLKLTQDSLEDMSPDIESGCKIEQIVRSVKASQGRVWQVNSDLTDKMLKADLIGLAIHETIYDSFIVLRPEGEPDTEQNSLRVRRIVGKIMSGKTIYPTLHYLKKPFIHCGNEVLNDTMKKLFDKSYIESLSESSRIQLYFKSKIAIKESADIFFFQNPQVSSPSITSFVDRLREVRLIGLNGISISHNINPSSDLKEFYKNLTRNSSRLIINSSDYSDVEFKTNIEFSMTSGHGTLEMTSSTGGYIPRPIENMVCHLFE